MAMDPDQRDRLRGILIGLAVGDALGAPVEFEPPSRIVGRRAELFEMRGGGGFGWAPGEFTDDTQMALVLARHLRDRDGTIDQQALALSFADWAREAADVGIQTRTVLSAVWRGVDWRSATGTLAPDAAGNGSLMRVAPVALPATSPDDAVALARAQSEVTHPNATCVEACASFAWTLWTTATGTLPSIEASAHVATRDDVRKAVRDAAQPDPPKMSGWVIETLTGAMWAVHGAQSFEDAIWRAVSLGRDADTVGAVAGALAGARWGLTAIPDTLVSALQSRHPMFIDDYPGALVTTADMLIDMRMHDRADRGHDSQ